MKRQLQDQELAALGRKLPFEAPTSQRVEHVRNELLSAAANLPPQRSAGRRRGWGLAVSAIGAIAAGIAVVALVWSTGSEPSRAPIAKRPVAPQAPVIPKIERLAPETPQDQRTNLATVHGTGEATFERKTLSLPSSPTDEVVYLNDGVIRLDVRPLQKGERFRVITPDAEIEVRGTSFRVAVSSGRLLEVEVLSGRVEVRPKGQAERTLSAQERWRSPSKPSARVVKKPRAQARVTAPTAGVTNVRPMKRKEPKLEPKVTPKPQAEDPMERAFREGWRMMRAKKYGRATEIFRAALRAHPDAPLSQDASYWLTVALLKSGDRASAARALERFLDRYPTAARAGEARVMLAGLLGRSAPARARALCAAALKDQSPKVRAKAQALIERLDQAGRNAP